MFKTILVAYDGSDHAKNALKVAAGLAKTFDASLYLSHTPQIDTPPIVIGAFVSELEAPPAQEQIDEAGEAIIKQAREEAKAEGMEITQTYAGRFEPANAILDAAKTCDADLIVLGRRGLGSLASLALGSVSQAVSHRATCACLTVL